MTLNFDRSLKVEVFKSTKFWDFKSKRRVNISNISLNKWNRYYSDCFLGKRLVLDTELQIKKCFSIFSCLFLKTFFWISELSVYFLKILGQPNADADKKLSFLKQINESLILICWNLNKSEYEKFAELFHGFLCLFWNFMNQYIILIKLCFFWVFK